MTTQRCHTTKSICHLKNLLCQHSVNNTNRAYSSQYILFATGQETNFRPILCLKCNIRFQNSSRSPRFQA